MASAAWPRGTSNSNDRGSAAQRRSRKNWILSPEAGFGGDGTYVPCARAKTHCNQFQLTFETMQVDRHPLPGILGGKYHRHNIRPLCVPCNRALGHILRGKIARGEVVVPGRTNGETMTNEIVRPRVELCGFTQFIVPESLMEAYDADIDLDYNPTSGGQHLAEFAGRACYQSWKKPNPATATNQGYLRHILAVGHGSVLEHGSVSFYITGISRSLTHELVRHRPGMAYSQLSQRYVDSEDAGIVVPPELRDSTLAVRDIRAAMASAVGAYQNLVGTMQDGLEEQGVSGTEARKRARQAARAVMPNMTETKIVVTGNLRAWRHFLSMRAAQAADHEIREVAMMVYDRLSHIVPNAVQDFHEQVLADGTRALAKDE
jgi:thymidylate synthase (FAD)